MADGVSNIEPEVSPKDSNPEEEHSMKINGTVVEELATDLYKLLDFDVSKEEVKFNDSVELMLTKLDEFFSLVDMIRSDTSLCLQTTMPDIAQKCTQMEAVFEKIDKLEEFVTVVRECVSKMEEKVTEAEGDLTTVGGLMKKLTSFISKKPSAASTLRGRHTEFSPPEIFTTCEYFPHSPHSEQQMSTSISSQQSSSDDGLSAVVDT